MSGTRPVNLDNPSQVRQWLSDLEQVVSQLTWVYVVHRAKLQQSLDAFYARQKVEWPLSPERLEELSKHLSQPQMEDLKRTLQHATLGSIVERFFENLFLAGEIAAATRAELDTLDSYRRRQPAKWQLVTALCATAVVFGLSVAYPMLSLVYETLPPAPSSAFVTVPLIFYAAMAIVFVAWVARL